MSATSGHDIPQVPGRIGLSSSVQAVAIAAVLGGGATLGWAFARGDQAVAWSAYLIGAFFALGLGVFGVAWLAILYLAGATWSVSMRRIPEAMTAWLVPGGLLTMALFFGAPTLYEWSHPAPGDELLAHKAPFLNMTMFGFMVGASLLAWVVFGVSMVSASRRQDRDGGMRETHTARTTSAIFMVVFAITLSIVSFYLLLSLDAHWFSTMFAVLVFTDVLQTGSAFVAIVAGALVLAGSLKGFVGKEHLHSLAKMVFATTGFWAYIYFCQFMLIWYANLPEETAYFMRRWSEGWFPYLMLLPLLKFVVPFLLLIPRAAKREAGRLIAVSAIIVFAQFLELYVMVGPAVGHLDGPAQGHVPIIEFAATAAFVGLFVLVFGRTLHAHEPVPLKDPALSACLSYHA